MRRAVARGATLLEFTVYLLVAVLITHLCCITLHTGYRFFVDYSRKTRRLAELHTALDLFARDIRRAPAARTTWQTIGSAELVWQQVPGALGWSYERGKLWRITGEYNGERGVWRKRAKSIVARDLHSCRFITYQSPNHDRVTAVEIELTAGPETVAIATCLRNGAI